jgi:hypothetical protein
MKFAQMINFRTDDPDGVIALMAETDRAQATADIMGYIGARLVANRDDPGSYIIIAEFAEVDGDLTAAEEAELNNLREETERFADQLRQLVEGEPEWVHFDELYRTGLTGDLRTG